MDDEASTSSRHDILEQMLHDENAQPTGLPLSLLEDITNHFSANLQVGIGGFAVVYKGLVGKGMVAVKKLSTTLEIHEKNFHGEVKCLMKAKHRNIVRFLGYCADTQGEIVEYEGDVVMADLRKRLLCFEYVPNGSLDKHITNSSGGLEWKERYRIIRGICEGLHYLHDKRILHLDLKPANILLDDHMVPKIADFGISRCFNEGQTHVITKNLCGTYGYFAPELWKGKITFELDIFSVGVIIVEILTGEKSYPEYEKVIESWKNRLKEETQLEQVRVCTEIGIECMEFEPKKRSVTQDIVDRLAKTASGDEDIDILERMLVDETVKPTLLPLSLLEHITYRFSVDHQISSGDFSVVYKGIVGNGMVAVKKLSKTVDMHDDEFHKEVECLMKTKHKNIVRFLGYCADTQGKMEGDQGKIVDQRNLLLCFEYLPKGSLRKYITSESGGLEWSERYTIIRGICEGLHYLHEMRILNLYLKPANILLDDSMVPKLAEFGFSRCLDDDQTGTITKHLRGTPGYLAQEFYAKKFSFASDIYSLGVIIMEIITGVKGYTQLEEVIESWMHRLESDMQLGQLRVCTKIGIECMELDPKKRPVARNIIDRLEQTTNADNSDDDAGMSSSSSVEQLQVSLLSEEQSAERIGNIAAETERLRELEMERLLFSSSNSGLFNKLNNFFNRKARRDFYRKNGGPILQNAKSIPLFKIEDLRPFLKDNNLIGEGRYGKVYKGLVDNVLVAIKKPIGNVHNEEFANEVIIQAQVMHRNIVRLIGCCLAVDAPMLVYEFVSKGSLDDILHKFGKKKPLSLDVRVSIAAESACGLSYMHSEAHPKILHGDVKPANILLDDEFVPKISDYGIWRLIARDTSHTVDFIGDLTYMDPVYLREGLLTEKSDVYSFGIVILELISRKKATHDNNLVKSFIEDHKKGKKSTELFDKEIAVPADMELLRSLAEIAVECLNLDVDKRPWMKDAAQRLLILNQNRSRRL